MDNITLVAVGIIALWLIAIAFYLVVSRQQEQLSKDVEELQETLDADQEGQS